MTKKVDDLIKEAEALKGLSFVEWKQKNHPGWYLGTRREDENHFEEYLDYLHENNFDYDELNPQSKAEEVER